MQAKVTLNGTLWRIKGRPDGLSGVVMRLNTKQPDLTIPPFPKPGTAGHFTPSRVWIEDANGTVVSELKNPRLQIHELGANAETRRTVCSHTSYQNQLHCPERRLSIHPRFHWLIRSRFRPV